MSEERKIEVHLKHKDFEKKIIGNVEEVLKELISFLTQIYPKMELASKLSLTVDVNELITACEGIIAITPEGVVTLVDVETLPDKELILFHLVKAKIGRLLNKSEKESLLISDILSSTKHSVGSVAGRLSELCSEGFVERIGKGEYRITTYGLDYFLKNVIPKLKR
ncbi:MAG: hypothetical protein QXR82_05315 [Candidatus Bathyarchaeia archaeon]|nr:hypothetical protein [Candidatus Bathyarchaeota archaeon]